MATEKPELAEAELIALAAVINVQVLGAQADLKRFGHLQVDPSTTTAYARMVKELVRRGVLPSDDSFAPDSPIERELAQNGDFRFAGDR